MASKKKPGLEALYESGAVMLATDDRLKIRRTSTGVPMLDALIGGGLVLGRNVLAVGPESTGKTLLAQLAAAELMRSDPAAKVMLIDAEFSYDPEWWAQSGIDLDRLIVTQPTMGDVAIDTMMLVCEADHDVRMVIVDSLAALNPPTLVNKETGERSIAYLAELLTHYYAKIPALLKRGVLVWSINQMRANIGGYDDVYPGGREQRHASHLILRLRREEWIKESDERVGYKMEVLIKKTKIGGQQESSCVIPVMFSSQIDLVSSYIEDALARRIITTAGPYYSYGENKWLGKAALRQALTDMPELLEKLKQEVLA